MARTRYQRGDQADSDCTPGNDVNKPLLSAETGGNETVDLVTVQGANVITNVEGAFMMAVGDPGGSEDLGAASSFRCQLDITAIGANQTVRVVFHALNASCVSQGSVAMAEGDFSSTGLSLATASWDPPVADRYAAYIHVGQGGMHSDPGETLTLRTNNSNAFFEIPDAPAAGVDIAVPLGTFSLSGQIPSIETGVNVDVPVGAFSLAGQVPSIETGVNVPLPAGAFSLAGQVPSVETGVNVDVPAGSFSLAGQIPSVASGVNADVPAGAFALTGFAPAINPPDGVDIPIPLGTFSLNGQLPAVASGAGIVVPAGAFSLAGQIPTIASGVNVDMPTNAYSFVGLIPIIAAGGGDDGHARRRRTVLNAR